MSKLDEIVKKNIGQATPNLRADTLRAIDDVISALKKEIRTRRIFKESKDTIKSIAELDLAYTKLKGASNERENI